MGSTSGERFRDDALTRALDLAIERGERGPLFDRLRRASGLPALRLNPGLTGAFAAEVARRGARADALVAAMLSVHEDVAPYGHVDEVLPILGVAAAGARAASDDKARSSWLEALEEASCDRRSRVRDQVAAALVEVGVATGPSFAAVLRRWLEDEQPYLARAAVTALGEPSLLAVLGGDHVVQLADVALRRVEREHRAGRRHDAFRKLVRAMEDTPAVMVTRYPGVTDVLVRHAASEDEDVRGILTETVARVRKGRNGDRAQQLGDALAASKKPSRDPRWDRLPGKRGRGKK